MRSLTKWTVAAIVAVMAMTTNGVSKETPRTTTIAVDDAKVYWSPYVWNRTGAGESARAEATMPGAYVKVAFRGSTAVRLLIDGAANNGCPPAAMPVVDYSLDNGAFQSVRLTKTGEVYAIPLGAKLDRAKEHRLEVCFRSASLGPDRWRASTVHLRIAGFELDEGSTLLPCRVRPKRAIGFGDSIFEGVCVEKLGPYYSDVMMNNARVTWFPLVCAALDCEYGHLGTGGQGMVRPIEIPPLPETWDHYDAATSRLTDGLLLPEPDYVFCGMGTNDHNPKDMSLIPIAENYARWLVSVRKACPNAAIFCVVPPLGWHAKEIAEVVAARNTAGDKRVFVIDAVSLRDMWSLKGATPLAFDGVHPSVYGNAMLGAVIAAEAQKALAGLRSQSVDRSSPLRSSPSGNQDDQGARAKQRER
jgi:hypothetical protein